MTVVSSLVVALFWKLLEHVKKPRHKKHLQKISSEEYERDLRQLDREFEQDTIEDEEFDSDPLLD
jgi:uncharacterized protein YfbU (UPF0304 family)